MDSLRLESYILDIFYVNGRDLILVHLINIDLTTVQCAQLLDPNPKQALEHADKAIALDPRDAAAHILKALALDVLGFKTSAFDAIDVALSPLCKRSQVEQERGDALYKRAEIKMAIRKGGDDDDGMEEDLREAVRLNPENAKAFCALGECYEKKEMKAEATMAFEATVKLQPRFAVAKEALERLGSS